MSFFEEVDSTGIIEHHIKQVLKLEGDQSDIVTKQYREIRTELIARLATMKQGTFTAQHLRGVLAQVEGALIAMNGGILSTMLAGSRDAAMKGVSHIIDEINLFDKKFTGAVTPINLNAVIIAQDTTQLLVTRYKSNLERYGKGIFDQIQHGLTQAAVGEYTYDEIVSHISDFFGGKEWELRRIVRTELHGIYNRGKMNAMEELAEDDPDMLKTLMHPMDSRTGKDSIYAAQKHLVAKIDEPFVYTWENKTREFMTPPDRPNDRSVMVPYRKEWGKLGTNAELPGKFPV